MKIFVLDASYFLSYLLVEEPKVEANFKKLLKSVKKGDAKVYSTVFLGLEISNVLFRKLDRKSAIEVYKKFLALNVEMFPLNLEQIKEVMIMTLDLDATTYDVSYHFVARFLGGTLLTCDWEYFKKAKEVGSIQFV